MVSWAAVVKKPLSAKVPAALNRANQQSTIIAGRGGEFSGYSVCVSSPLGFLVCEDEALTRRGLCSQGF